MVGKASKDQAFRELLAAVGEQISSRKYSKLFCLCDFTEEDKESCQNGLDILVTLRRRGDIGPDKTSTLKEAIRHAGIGGFVDMVEAYEKEYQEESQKEHQQPLLHHASPVLTKVEASPCAGSSMGPPPLQETGVSPISGCGLAQRAVEEHQFNDDSTSMEDIEKARKYLREALQQEEEADLYPYQERTINNLLAGKSTVLICRTGGGKSAVYFLVTKILRERSKRSGGKIGPTLVISPLLAVVNDQRRAAERFGLIAETYNGSTKYPRRIEKKVGDNLVDILFVTPETLTGDKLAGKIPQLSDTFNPAGDHSWSKVAMLVLDEIHCVSDWGHHFRPAYFQKLREELRKSWAVGVVKLGTSATVPERVMEDIARICKEDEWEPVRASLNRPELHIRIVSEVADQHSTQVAWVKRQIQDDPNQNVLLFADTESNVQNFADACEGRVYHAKLPYEEREEIEKGFIKGDIKFVCSTTALSMGFDKRDIGVVIVAYTPATLSQFYQMIGRAGRSGFESIAYILPRRPSFDKSMLSRERAIQKIINVAIREKSFLEEDIVKYLTEDNQREKTIKDAIGVLLYRGCLARFDGRLWFNHDRAKDEAAIAQEIITKRRKERDFMENLVKASSCIWAMMLDALGDSSESRCENCSICDATAHPHTHTRRIAVVWKFELSFGEGRKVSGFAFGHNNEVLELDPADLEQLLEEHFPDVRPSEWEVVFIPGTAGNAEKAQEIAKHFGAHCSSFVTPVYPEDDRYEVSLMTAQTDFIREQRLGKKFPPAAFDNEEIRRIASRGKNVLIYDDAVKSGFTARHVLAPLLEELSSSKKLVLAVSRSYGAELVFTAHKLD